VRFIGLMSGTSMDAIDTVLAEITDQDLEVLEYRQFPIPRDLQARVRAVHGGTPVEDITALDVILGEAFAGAVNDILAASHTAAGEVAAVGSHGQTVLHLPSDKHPRTLQIGDPNIIAARTGITTVADFRRADIAAGGQGAPLACAFHAWRFRAPDRTRVVLNLGGMANITVLPADADVRVTGFDTGPGNALMDLWIQDRLGRDYDEDGRWAGAGAVDDELLGLLLDDPYFNLPPPKSTGKDEFNLAWLKDKLNGLGRKPEPESIQATLLELTIRTVAAAIDTVALEAQEILLCGGGARNPLLVAGLEQALPGRQVRTTAVYGVDPDAVEAITFAWLAKRRLDGLPGNIPAVTGAVREVVLGAVYRP
jgi:anhydro-N-acetylmuramic acid kinase